MDSFDSPIATVSTIFQHLYSRSGKNDEATRLVALLEAVKATISDTIGPAAAATAPPSAYFGALMAALEKSGVEHARDIFYLQSMLLPHVPTTLVRTRYDAMWKLFSSALGSPAVVSDARTLRSMLTCLGLVLKAVEATPEAWAAPSVAQPMAALVSFSVDSRPKVRRSAQASVLEVLQSHYTNKSHACNAVVARNLATAMTAGSQKSQTRALQVLPLVRSAAPLLSIAAVTDVCDALLTLPPLGQPRLAALSYATLATLLESPRARLSIKFVSRLLAALLTVAPSPDNHLPASEFAYALAAGLTRLASMERVTAGLPADVAVPTIGGGGGGGGGKDTLTLSAVNAVLVTAVQALLPNFESGNTAVLHATANSLAIILTTCITPTTIAAATAHATTSTGGRGRRGGVVGGASSPILTQIIESLEGVLQFKYQGAWAIAIPLFALLARICGEASATLLASATLALVALRGALESAAGAIEDARDDDSDAEDDARGRASALRAAKRRRPDAGPGSDGEHSDGEGGGGDDDGFGPRLKAEQVEKSTVASAFKCVNRVLAACVRVMGAPAFTALVRFNSTPGEDGISEDRMWLLPLLRDNCQYGVCSISFVTTVILPLIRGFEEASAAAAAANLPKNARSLRARVMQLWSLLPSLLVAPSGFAAGFDVSLAKTLAAALNDARYPELPATIARSFETLIARARAALGMPSVFLGTGSGEDGGDGDDMSMGGRGADVDAGLTVMGGGGGGKSRKRGGKGKAAASDSDDDDDDDDGDGDDGSDSDGSSDGGRGGRAGGGAGHRGHGGDDDEGGSVEGATTVFGAGGVSVYASGAGGSSDPRHLLLVQALAPKDKLPLIAPAAATEYLDVLKGFAKNILPVFFSCYEACVSGRVAPDDTGASVSANIANERTRKLLDAVSLYLSIAPLEVVGSMGERLLKLLAQTLGAQVIADRAVAEVRVPAKARSSASPAALAAEALALREAASVSTRVLSLLSLALALVPSLPPVVNADDEGSPVARFFHTIRPCINDDTHPRCQKRAYTYLAALFSVHPRFATGSDARREEIVTLLRDSLMTLSVSAKRGRLICLRYVVRALSEESPTHMALIPLLLGEVMLCTKDSNGKVREASFALLAAMARRMADGGDGDPSILGEAFSGEGEEEGSNDDDDGDVDVAAVASAAPPPPLKINLVEFFRMVLGGFGATTPHMRSASVRALARLIYEFSERAVVHNIIAPILGAALDLLKEKSREVATAVVGFVKVCISCMPPAELYSHLPAIITGLMVWSGETKNRIRGKVKGVLERLVRKYGFDEIAAMMPASDVALISHMRKMAERRERKRASAAAGLTSGGVGGGEGATALTGARTAFEDMAGIRGGGGEDEDDDGDSAFGGDDDDDGAATRVTAAASVAKSWGIVGSKLTAPRPGTTSTAAGGGVQVYGPGSRMSAVTAQVRHTYRELESAPLPPIGSIIVDENKSVRSKGRGAAAAAATTTLGAKSRMTAAAAAVSGKGSFSDRSAFATMLRADDDSPIDLLDGRAMRSVVGADPIALAALDRQRRVAAGRKAAGNVSAGGIKVGPDGRLVIEESSDEGSSDTGSGGDETEEAGAPSAADRRRRRRNYATAGEDEDDEMGRGGGGGAKPMNNRERKAEAKAKYEARSGKDKGAATGGSSRPGASSTSGTTSGGEQGWGMKKGKAGGAPKEHGERFTGAQFKSKTHTGGDVARKGSKFEPFAYVPIGKSAAGAEGRFSGVVATTSKAGRAGGKRDASESVLGKRSRGHGNGHHGAHGRS